MDFGGAHGPALSVSPSVADPGQRVQLLDRQRCCAVRDGELDDVLGAERRDRAREECRARSPARGRRSPRDRTGLRFVHVVRRQQDRAAAARDSATSSSQSWRRDCGSSPVVGSSRNSRSGSPTSAQATARRCFCPPDSLPHPAGALSTRARRARARRRRCGRGGRSERNSLKVSSTESFSLSCVSCSWIPRRARRLRSSPRPQRSPEHLDLAFVGCGQAFEDLDRRRLAGAVWAEQAEALAAAHFEVEAADGDDVGVALDETVTADGEATHDRGIVTAVTLRFACPRRESTDPRLHRFHRLLETRGR